MDNMEGRKVLETDKGTLFMTLPKDWCKKYSISKDAVLEVEVEEDSQS